MKRLFLALVCLAILSGCGTIQRINPFARAVPEQPLPFQARLNATRGAPDFAVTVQTRGAALEQWRESARFQGTQHCIRRFGLSDIRWQSSGAPENWIVARSGNGTAIVRGRCDIR